MSQYSCTCPDDENWDGYACKHVVATLFALSDEFLLEPELLDLWRGRTSDDTDHLGGIDDDDLDDDDLDGGPEDDLAGRGTVEDSGDRRRGTCDSSATTNDRGARPPPADPLVDLLRRPEHTELPDVGDIERIEPLLPRSRELSNVLRDALGNLRIEWE